MRFTAATITAHHLLYNRNALFTGGIRPHYYCLPVLKRELHRQALLQVVASGSPRFFLGTDSAPHAAHLKEHASRLCRLLHRARGTWRCMPKPLTPCGALDKLEGLASFHGADFYGLPRNTGTHHPATADLDAARVLCLWRRRAQALPRAGEALPWQLV
jgi:dihydroorotase